MVVTATGVVVSAFLLARLGVQYHMLGTGKVGQDVLVLSANLLADVVRDAFDPRLREEVV